MINNEGDSNSTAHTPAETTFVPFTSKDTSPAAVTCPPITKENDTLEHRHIRRGLRLEYHRTKITLLRIKNTIHKLKARAKDIKERARELKHSYKDSKR